MEQVENPFLALPAEITLHIASYVCNLALDVPKTFLRRNASTPEVLQSSTPTMSSLLEPEANQIALKCMFISKNICMTGFVGLHSPKNNIFYFCVFQLFETRPDCLNSKLHSLNLFFHGADSLFCPL
jgi:hypothetical protein